VDVTEKDANMTEMLKLTGGNRDVPVIVEDGRVKVGFGGS
jgi:glutaredoxin